MYTQRLVGMPACLVLLLFVVFGSESTARSFLIEGEGLRSNSTSSPIGVPGEEVTISVMLNTDDFYYLSVSNPIWHLFKPLRTIPVSVVGEQSGSYPSVSPISRLLALELTDEPNVDDQIGLGVAAGNTSTSLFSIYCQNNSCFDGDQGPFTPDGMFDLLEEAFNDTANWRMGSANPAIFAGPSDSFISFSGFEWTLTDPDAPSSVSIEPTFDAAYLLGETPQLVDGETVLRVGGFVGSSTFPVEKPIFEFPLSDIPRSADILSATLQLDPYVSSGAPRIEVVGFAGDGTASLRDGTIDGPLLAVTPPMSVSSYEDIELDPVYIESLLGGASHIGLRLQNLSNFDYLGFDASENTFGSSQPPTLVIEYVSNLLPGDYNADGVVDAADYTVWRDGGSPDSSQAGYDLWRTHYGAVTEALSSSTATHRVPEPTAAVSLLLACWGIMIRHRVG